MKNVQKYASVVLVVLLVLISSCSVFAAADTTCNYATSKTFSLPVSSTLAEENFRGFSETTYNFTTMRTERLDQSRNYTPNTRAVGQVYDYVTAIPIPQALLTFSGEDVYVEVKTDSEGAFAIDNLPVGTYDITISTSGYENAVYRSMPVTENSGADFYYLAISENCCIERNYAEDISTGDQREFDDEETSAVNRYEPEPVLYTQASSSALYSLKSYMVDYDGDIYSFGSNINAYLYCVVPNEMIATGTTAQKLEAYKAQAVASRAYADCVARFDGQHPSEDYTLCSGECCQKFVPYYTNAAAIQAVNIVSGQTLAYLGENTPIRAPGHFHARCGGRTRAYREYSCENSVYVTCVGHGGSQLGHGFGMCQIGADYLAKNRNYSYTQILNYYYPEHDIITASLPNQMGINPGETYRFTATSSGKDFITYAPLSTTYTISVNSVSDDSRIVTFSIMAIDRNDAGDIVEETVVVSSRTGTVSVSLAKGEYLIRTACTNASSTAAMVKIKCNAACATITEGEVAQGKTDFSVIDVVEKIVKFIPSSTGSYDITTSSLGSSSYDTYLKVTDSTGSTLGTNDDVSASDTFSKLTLQLSANRTYYIIVTTSDYISEPNDGQNFRCTVNIE